MNRAPFGTMSGVDQTPTNPFEARVVLRCLVNWSLGT
jgi:hypothetical protein